MTLVCRRGAVGLALVLAASALARGGVGVPVSPAPSPRLDSPAAAAPAADSPGLAAALALQQRYVDIAARANSSVVSIKLVRNDVSPDGKPVEYYCTGFFIDHAGHILTANAKFLAGARSVWFTYQGNVYGAEIAGVDLNSNLAVLRALKLPANFTPLEMADASADSLPLGSLLLGITCKVGEAPAPSPGLVRGYNITYGDNELPTRFLRAGIPDDGGEEGSPVFDLLGRLVGVMDFSLPDSHSTLVLPVRAVQRVADDLLAHGKAAYGLFGFKIKQVNVPDEEPQVVVVSVDYGGPAGAAGLHIGDQLISINGQSLHGDEDLRQAAFFSHPNDKLTFTVRRDGLDIPVPLVAGELQMRAPTATADAPPGSAENPATETAATSTTPTPKPVKPSLAAPIQVTGNGTSAPAPTGPAATNGFVPRLLPELGP